MAEQARTVALALIALADADVEQVGFVDHRHDDRKADQLAAQAQHPDAVAAFQRVGKIAARPRKNLQAGFERRHRIEVALVHRKKLGRNGQRTHARPPSFKRSATVFATLSRI